MNPYYTLFVASVEPLCEEKHTSTEEERVMAGEAIGIVERMLCQFSFEQRSHILDLVGRMIAHERKDAGQTPRPLLVMNERIVDYVSRKVLGNECSSSFHASLIAHAEHLKASLLRLHKDAPATLNEDINYIETTFFPSIPALASQGLLKDHPILQTAIFWKCLERCPDPCIAKMCLKYLMREMLFSIETPLIQHLFKELANAPLHYEEVSPIFDQIKRRAAKKGDWQRRLRMQSGLQVLNNLKSDLELKEMILALIRSAYLALTIPHQDPFRNQEMSNRQALNLHLAINDNRQAWVSKAKGPQSRYGKVLINRHTEEGKALILSIGNTRTLADEFNIHSMLVDKEERVFVRYKSSSLFAEGAFKKIYKVQAIASQREYAWAVMKGKEPLAAYNSSTMEEFRALLRSNPHLAFNQVNEFEEYQSSLKTQVGVSVEQLYDGDAYELTNLYEPSLKQGSILKLAEAITFLHQHSFAHRDLKNENILIKDGNAVWTDYESLCKLNGTPLDHQGTSGYIPFEQGFYYILKTPLDTSTVFQADVFAFAASLFQNLNPDFKPKGYLSIRSHDYLLELKTLQKENPALFDLHLDQVDSWQPEQRAALLQLWLEQKQKNHEENIPLQEPFLAYKQMLWQAMSPDPTKRPTAAEFEARLIELARNQELPV